MFRHFFLVCVATLAVAAVTANAQFPVTIQLDAERGSSFVSPPTQQDIRYRITVEGTWSPDSALGCTLADAIWMFDPSGMGATLASGTDSMVWIGDTAVVKFKGQGRAVPHKHLGFRIDGRPLPMLPPDHVLHRYQFTQTGNGDPFEFTILDSALDITSNDVYANYAAACGGLRITVEEISQNSLNICGVETRVAQSGAPQLCIRANLLQKDGKTGEFDKNMLRDLRRVGVVCDGNFVCADSMSCDETREAALDVALVVDNSGSMGSPIVFGKDSTTRMRAAQMALTNFISSRRPGDQVSITRFDTTSVLAANWTSDHKALSTAIYKLKSFGNTALHRAILDALASLAYRPNPQKVLIVMTDGVNNRAPLDEKPVIDAIRRAHVPVYIIALGFSDTPEEREGISAMKRFVQAAPAGQLFYANRGEDLLDVYSLLSANIATEPCCKIYVTIPPCIPGIDERNIMLAVPYGNDLISKKITFNCVDPHNKITLQSDAGNR